MLVDKTHSSTPPESHESRFHKEEFPFFWVVNVYARYTQLMEIELKKNRHRPFPLPRTDAGAPIPPRQYFADHRICR